MSDGRGLSIDTTPAYGMGLKNRSKFMKLPAKMAAFAVNCFVIVKIGLIVTIYPIESIEISPFRW
jgi:hypothetical protein